jgi:hypothetical protein
MELMRLVFLSCVSYLIHKVRRRKTRETFVVVNLRELSESIICSF